MADKGKKKLTQRTEDLLGMKILLDYPEENYVLRATPMQALAVITILGIEVGEEGASCCSDEGLEEFFTKKTD